jgi:ATP-dependent 26S proteasome regulatory subunit
MVFTLAKTMQGYQIHHIGLAGSPIERGNYSSTVLAAYDHIVTDLNAESPCGRLVVLAGDPGTGKTWLVRSLLSEAQKAAFILVPPHLVEELGSPEILPSLTAAKNEMNGPIVMVIEDADACLVPRQTNKTGNINAISSLLNLGDGILGSVLDLRIIATTNAHRLEMDPAITRPGRLCKGAHVGPLPADQAAQVLYRLTGKRVAFSKQATLAEIYLQARNLGWKPPPAQNTAAEQPMRTEILEYGGQIQESVG